MFSSGHNKKVFLDRRRELRARQTDAESKLWHYLRDGRLLGFKFCRQYGVGPYILDFFCFEAHLAIELDGGQHATPEQNAYDAERTGFLIASGIKVIRFWNHEVLTEIEEVLEAIGEALKEILP